MCLCTSVSKVVAMPTSKNLLSWRHIKTPHSLPAATLEPEPLTSEVRAHCADRDELLFDNDI